MPEPRPVDGLARQRTDLAWNRSGLAVVTCIAVGLRRMWPLHGTRSVVALGCISAGAVVWALALTVGRATSDATVVRHRHLSGRRAGAITAGTLAIALAGLVLAFFPPS